MEVIMRPEHEPSLRGVFGRVVEGVARRVGRRQIDTAVQTEVTNLLKPEILQEQDLVPILEWGYGQKNWAIRNPMYWKDQEWEYRSPDQRAKRLWSPEVQRTYRDLRAIMEWTSSEETRQHLDPAPGVPRIDDSGKTTYYVPDWRDQDQVDHAIVELAKRYYNNGKPQQITTLMVRHRLGELMGVGTGRWQGDKYIPSGKKIGGIELVVTNPKYRRMGVAMEIMSELMKIGHEKHGLREFRAWVMTDTRSGNFSPNINLLLARLGFLPSNRVWREGARMAMQFSRKIEA